MMCASIVYLDGRDLERDSEVFVRFRLTYEGNLLSSKPAGDTVKRIAHKHHIRQVFHRQLKQLWKKHRYLNRQLDSPSKVVLPAAAIEVFKNNPSKRPMAEVLGDVYGHHGFR